MLTTDIPETMEYKPTDKEHDREVDTVQQYVDQLLLPGRASDYAKADTAAGSRGADGGPKLVSTPAPKIVPAAKPDNVTSLPLRIDFDSQQRRRTDQALDTRPFAEPEPGKLKLPLLPLAPPEPLTPTKPVTDAAVTEARFTETSATEIPVADLQHPARTETPEEKKILARETSPQSPSDPVSEPTSRQPVAPVKEKAISEEKALAEEKALPEDAQPAVPEPVVPALEPADKTRTQWLANGRPRWAQSRFDVLLFKVGGLSLAVPLVELGTIYPIDEPLTPIFGQVDWFMGLLKVKGRNLATVNTAKVVMPERYQESMAEGFEYVLSIDGCDWGLAVDSVAHAISLDPDEVRWRSERSKRPWLAGTVVEHMCALIDLSQLADMIATYKPSRRR